MGLYEDLQALTGGSGLTSPTNGAAGPDDAGALAQLILKGGKASIGGSPIFGGAAPNPVEEAATRAEMGGYGRRPNAALAAALRDGSVDPAAVLDRPITPGGGPGNIFVKPSPDVTDQALLNGAHPPVATTNVVPLNSNLQKVAQTAGHIADVLSPETRVGKQDIATAFDLSTPHADKTLLPNPYGPGSFDPHDPQSVAKVQAQGQKAEKIREAHDILTSGILEQLPPGAPIKDIVKSIFESTGVVQTDAQKEKAKAQAKAEGEIAGGKGKHAIPTSVTDAIGKPEFQNVYNAAVASGDLTDPTVQNAVLARHAAALKNQQVESTDRRLLSGLQASQNVVNDLKDAYEKTPAFKTGKLSDTLKAALATNGKATSLLEFNPIDPEGLNPDEIDFATKYNTMLARLRDFSGDTRFSDNDATRTLRAIGNVISGPKVFPKQLQNISDDLGRRQQITLNDIEASGRDVSKLRALRGGAKQPSAPTTPQVGFVSKGYRFNGGDPSKPESWEKVKKE